MLCYCNNNKNKYDTIKLDKSYFVGKSFGEHTYITLSLPSSLSLTDTSTTTLFTKTLNQYVNQMYINISLLCQHSYTTTNPYPYSLQFSILCDNIVITKQIVQIHPQKYFYCNFFQSIPVNKNVTTLKININEVNSSTSITLSPATNAQQFIILY